MPEGNEGGNGDWRNIFIGLLVTLVLASFGFTFVVSDSKVDKDTDREWKKQHIEEHSKNIQTIKEGIKETKEDIRDTKEDIKIIRDYMLNNKRGGK